MTGRAKIETMQKALRRFLGDSGGFTLMELLLVIGITGLGIGMVGSGIFQVLPLQQSWREDSVATRNLRHAGSWFNGDALNAETTSLADGAAPVDSVTISWVNDQDGTPHTTIYSVTDDSLIRDIDGVQHSLSDGVVSASFSRSGKVITFSLTVTAAYGAAETMTWQTYSNFSWGVRHSHNDGTNLSHRTRSP